MITNRFQMHPLDAKEYRALEMEQLMDHMREMVDTRLIRATEEGRDLDDFEIRAVALQVLLEPLVDMMKTGRSARSKYYPKKG